MTPERADLGMLLEESVEVFRGWDPRTDPDVGRDLRMMVPVFHDVQREQTRVWAVLGVTSRPLDIRYRTPPELTAVADADGNSVDLEKVTLSFESVERQLADPGMVETYVTRILNRDEFRPLRPPPDPGRDPGAPGLSHAPALSGKAR